jgi:uncharacterized alpha-E superfamily protein
MLCRVAEDIFWMSRYVERTIAVGRLIDVTWHLELDDGETADARAGLWARLLTPRPNDGGLPPALVDAARTPPDPRAVRHWLAFDASNPRSLVSCVSRGRAAAHRVRESISSEMWESLNTLHLSLADPALSGASEDDPHAFYGRVTSAAVHVQGLADATLAHDEAWHFACIGKFLERADNVAHVLGLQTQPRHGRADGEDVVRWIAVLRSCGSAEAYARHYSLRVEPARVVEFLLLNSAFPQTVRFSLTNAYAALDALGAAGAAAALRSLGLLAAQLEHAVVDEVMETGLHRYLTVLQSHIERAASQITRDYLRDEPQPGRLVAVARAAMLMAEQQ